LKTFLRIVKYLFLVIGLLVVYALISIVLSYIPVNKDQSKHHNQDLSVFILTNGVHSDIIIPYQNDFFDWNLFLDASLTPGKTINPQWVAFGWGDKGFYLQTPEWKDLKTSVALKAALGLSQSAMHVTYYENLIANGEDCIEIKLNKEQYIALCTFIYESFDTKNDGFQWIDTDQNYGLNDVFYEAKGRYNIFYTCNTWVNDVLKSAKLKTSFFTLWDKGIFYHYTKK